MRQCPLQPVLAKPQQLLAPAQDVARQIVERVHLMGPRRRHPKSSRPQPVRQCARVSHAKFDFDFLAHRGRLYYGTRTDGPPMPAVTSGATAFGCTFQTTVSTGPTTKTQWSAPIQAISDVIRKGQ